MALLFLVGEGPIGMAVWVGLLTQLLPVLQLAEQLALLLLWWQWEMWGLGAALAGLLVLARGR